MVVEPIDVVQGGVLDIIQSAPGALVTDQLRLVQAVEGFGQGIVLRIPARSHRSNGSHLGQTLGVANGQILHPAIGMVDEARQPPSSSGP